MNKLIILLLSALLQLSRAGSADDAQAALNDLRQVTSDNLNGGFVEHTKMSMEVDQVALDTKDQGQKAIKEKTQELLGRLRSVKVSPVKALQYQKTLLELAKVTADTLDECVNMHASEAIDTIYTRSSGLTDKALETIYDEEKAIIVCGREDDDCLTSLIAEIGTIEKQMPDIVNDEIEADRAEVEKHIEAIKGCAAAAIKKARNFDKL